MVHNLSQLILVVAGGAFSRRTVRSRFFSQFQAKPERIDQRRFPGSSSSTLAPNYRAGQSNLDQLVFGDQSVCSGPKKLHPIQ